jgi:hypothetical protein
MIFLETVEASLNGFFNVGTSIEKEIEGTKEMFKLTLSDKR